MTYYTLYSQTTLYCQFLSQKYALLYFCLVSSDFLIIFAQKFIMSYYGAERYNEATSGNPALNTVKKILEVLGIEIDYKVRQTI